MSFIYVEPQSRVFLESHSNSLLAKFDIQLEILTDRYLAFFRERRSIEATYIDSLRKLHRKATLVDASFDPRAEPTTTRAAWDKVRDNLEREANTQQAFVDILENDVIKPLAILKETEDQTRKRVEEDLQESAAKYADHAENTILRLQQAYFKKYHPRFEGSRREDLWGLEPTRFEELEVSDDDCRLAVGLLNTLRLNRVENLGDGYDCLEELVFTPTVKNVLVKYMDGMMITACTKHDDLAMVTRAEVEDALAGIDTSDLRASFRRALSFSIPPLTLYRNYPTDAYSDLIFGVPLVDVTTNQNRVPKVVRMCIEEVEKRGLDTNKIYLWGSIHDAEVLQLRRRFESEKTFSFRSTDNIYSIAMLLKLYFRDLPEPLFMLGLQDYRRYRQNRTRYTENDFSVLRSKIHGLHPVHRASLGALMRHLLCVASHSDNNAMTAKALAAQFCYTVLRGNAVLEGGVHAKKLVMEDLIQNAHTLFDERPPPSSPAPSPHVAETMSMLTLVEGRLTPTPNPLLSPLLGLPSSQTSKEGVETTVQEQAVPVPEAATGTQRVEPLPSSSPPEVASLPPTSVAEWLLHHPHPEAPTVPPRSPSESVLSGATDLSLSPAASFESATMETFPPEC